MYTCPQCSPSARPASEQSMDVYYLLIVCHLKSHYFNHDHTNVACSTQFLWVGYLSCNIIQCLLWLDPQCVRAVVHSSTILRFCKETFDAIIRIFLRHF